VYWGFVALTDRPVAIRGLCKSKREHGDHAYILIVFCGKSQLVVSDLRSKISVSWRLGPTCIGALLVHVLYGEA
jgi:hypothetical protein